ncbi:MAG: L,D-transpeptidase family protein [Chloroflexi bacterium]|nr:L,D-transpeptidase family protein [Chloroflexota bacterium]MCI0578514.1 L,D-transpeptidase family protein [Chloroflexota bacterium]
MSDEVERALQAAREAIQAGRLPEARQLLQQAARQAPADYRPWLWLAGIAGDPAKSLAYARKAEAINPGHPSVQKARQWAEQRMQERGGTRGQGDKETRGQGDKETRRQGDKETGISSHPVTPTPLHSHTPTPPHPHTPTPARRPFFLAAAAAGVLVFLLVATVVAGSGWLNSRSQQVAQVATPTLGAPREPAGQTQAESPPAGIAPLPGPEQATATPTPNPLQPKNIVAGSAGPRSTWTPTARPTETPTPTPTYQPTFVADLADATIFEPLGLVANERWIDVNLSTQTLVAYEGQLPVFDSLISSGKRQYPTVKGQFRIWLRFVAQDMDGRRLGYDYYLKNVPYVQYFYQDYALHGTFWHNNFGNPMSHGCVNLPTPAAEWLYNWASYGTLVNIHD